MNRTQNTSKFYFRPQLIKPLSIVNQATAPTENVSPTLKIKKFKINTFANSDNFSNQKQSRLYLPKVTFKTNRASGIIRSSSLDPSCMNYQIEMQNQIKKMHYLKTQQNQQQDINEVQQTQKNSNLQTFNQQKQNHFILYRLIKQIQHLQKNQPYQKYSILIQYFIKTNTFFKQLSPILLYNLLKSFKINYYSKQRLIHKATDKLSSFYIVLNGRLKIIDSNNQKYILSKGDIVNQQLLFLPYQQNNIRKSNAKAISNTILMQINYQKYLTFCRNLTLKGLKTELLGFQNRVNEYHRKMKQQQLNKSKIIF